MPGITPLKSLKNKIWYLMKWEESLCCTDVMECFCQGPLALCVLR